MNSTISFMLILLVGSILVSAKSSKDIEVVGPCINNLCPHTYECNRDECIREKPKARAGISSIGPCINTQCPVGHVCVGDENQCYPLA